MFGIFNQIFGGSADAVDVKALIDQGALLIDKLKQTGKPVVAYCRSGNRSGMAAQILNEKGIEAYNAGSVGQVRQMLAK